MHKQHISVKTLGTHIDYLLGHHDCVTIPGLGAVLAHCVPARYDAVSAVWIPPVRALSFNPGITRSDGLLAASVARRDGVSPEAAARMVRAGADEMRRCLDDTGCVALGHAGVLRRLDGGGLAYEPSDALWLSPSSMWLPSLPQPLMESAAKTARYSDDGRDRRSLWPLLLRRVGSAAACVAVIFALAWGLTSNLRNAPAEQFASVGPSPERASSAIRQPGRADAPMILVINRHADAVIDVEPRPVADRVETGRGYYMIVASLPDREEAAKFIRQYPALHLGILAMDGRYRVFAAKGESMAEAMEAGSRPEIAAVFPSRWVCRK